MKKIFHIFIISLFILLSVRLSADTGETGASFLNLGVGANSIGMGGAVTSVSSGVHALFWNPGGLGWLRGTEVTIMHAEYFQSIRYENLGIAHGSKMLGIGFSMKGIYLSGIEERTAPSENPLSTFGAYFITSSFSLGRSITRNISLGTSIKLIYQTIAEDNAVSFSNDIGLAAQGGVKGLKAGVSLINWGTMVKFENRSFSLPTKIRTGLSYSPFNGNLIFAFDVAKPFRDDFEFCIGAQGVVRDRFCLRAGYRSGFHYNGSFGGLTAGLGFKINDIDVDYALSGYGVLGLTHYFSISCIFGRTKRMEKQEEMLIAERLQQRASMTADVFYEQGLELQTDGAYEEALRNYDIALIWDPDHEPASKNLESLERMMKEREADKHLAQGIAHFEKGNYIDAIAAFGRVLEIEPTNESANNWFKTASDLLVKEQMKKMQVKKELSDRIAQYFAHGLDMYSKKKYTAAINEWEKIISIDPTHQAAHDYIRKAELKIKEQVEELVKNVDWYMSSGKWHNALHEINRALVIEPSNDDVLTKKKKIKAALRKLSTEHAQKGIKLYDQGKYGLADTEFKMALNYDSNNKDARDYLTRIESKEKELSGEDVSEFYMNGVNAYTREDYQMAIFYWKRVLENDPHHVNARRNLERAEEKLKISAE